MAAELNPETKFLENRAPEWRQKIGTSRVNTDEYNRLLPSDTPAQEGAKAQQDAKISSANPGYTVSEDGKAKRLSTGEAVQIQEIESIDGGKMTFLLKDGSTADASDIEYSSEGEALIYETVAGLDVGARAANILVNAFNTSNDVSAQDYALGIQEAFRYGLWNAPRQDLNNGPFSSALTEHQRNVAYENGRIAASQRAEQAQASRVKQDGQKAEGKVHFDGDRSGLNSRQRASLSALETVAKVLGVQIHVFESGVDADGKHIGENGWYDPKDGSIHIDLYSGVSGQDTMLFTAAHELTHLIRQWSPAKFKVLSDFLMEQYGKHGVSVRDLVEEQIGKAKRNGRSIDYDTAYEEVIADSMETMLADGKVVEKLAKLEQRDKSLWQKMKDYIGSLVERIRRAYAGLKPDSLEGRLVAQMKDSVEKLQKLFYEGLADAGESYQGAEVKENTAQEDGVKYQARRLSDDDIPEYLAAGNRRNKNKMSAWNAGQKIILTSEQEITDFIDRAIDKQLNHNMTVAYGKVNERLAQDVLSASNGKIRIKDNFLELIPDNLQHAYEQHSRAKQDGDIDLGRSDFEKIPEYLDSFTEVVYAIEYSSGKVGVCVSKKLPNGRILLIEAVSKSRGALQFKNAIGVSEEKYQTDYIDVYKKRAGTNTRGSESSNNSLRDNPNSNNSIRENVPPVKPKFDGEQVKSATENVGTFNSGNPDIRYSDRDPSVARLSQKQEEETSSPYSYESLTAKPDMLVTTVGGDIPKNRADVVYYAKQNAAKIGKFNPKDGSVSVHVKDTNTDVVLSTNGLKHGLDRRFDINAPVTLQAGKIISNSIRINELTPAKSEVDSSYVLIGAAKAENGDLLVVQSVVNRFSSELETMDVLYAINAKKGNRLRSMRPGFQGPVTDSTISIAELLEYVNQNFPDVLPEDVLKHYGHEARPAGKLGESALYSDRDPSIARMNQALEKENTRLKEDVAELKKLLRLQKSLTHGTMFTRASVAWNGKKITVGKVSEKMNRHPLPLRKI